MLEFPTTAAERERRAYLARVEQALRAAGATDLRCEYVPIDPVGAGGPVVTGLIVTCPGAPGEARVVAVAFEQQHVSTDPRAAWPDEPAALAVLRARLQSLGIAGVAHRMPRYDRFPGDGAPAYELSIVAPDGPDAAPGTGAVPVRRLDGLTSPEARAIAQRILVWREAIGQGYPPGPRDPASLKSLRAIAQARRTLRITLDEAQIEQLRRAGRLADAWRLAGLATTIDLARGAQPDVHPTPGAREALQADLAALLPVHLQWHFPRDERGQLALGVQVLLAAYESAVPLSQGRQLWLTAVAPGRRRDPQVITLQVAPLIGENHTHVWADARWRWDARAVASPPLERWGVDDLPLDRLGLEPRSETDGLARACTDATVSPVERAAACIRLQDAGRLREALALFDVDLADPVARLVAGAPVEQAALQEVGAWARATQEALRQAAPWRFEPLLRQAALLRERWVAEKRSRKWSAPTLRLFWLPHQTQQVKVAVVLRARERDGSRPRLDLESSASNARLPAAAWQRPPEIDLVRFGLLGQDEIV